MKKIVVVGGGISGLATAYYLRKKAKVAGGPFELTLIEASPRFGGKIVTERDGGLISEGGPDCFLSTKPEAIALCEELGLSEDLVCTRDENKGTFILCRGRLEPIPAGMESLAPARLWPFAMTRLLSPEGKVRALWELFVAKRQTERDESVADFIERRFGPEFYMRLAEPLLSGISAGDARTLSLLASFPRLVELEKRYGSLLRAVVALRRHERKKKAWSFFVTLRDGLDQMVRRLVSVLELDGVRLRAGVEAIGLRRRGSGYEVVLKDGNLEADAVVLATPSYDSAGLLESLDAYLSAELEQLHYNASATVTLAYDKEKFPHPLRGHGFVVPKAEGKTILACTWTSSKYPDRAPEGQVSIRGYLGESRKQHWQKLSDERLAFLVREDLDGIMGLWQEPVLTRVFRWERGIPHYGIGHQRWLESLSRRLRSYPGLHLTGAAYHGIGIPDCIRQAAQTAEQALAGPGEARAVTGSSTAQ